MKRCTAVCTRSLQLAGVNFQPRRCVSYDKSLLTPEALRAQVESGLGVDEQGKALTIDPETKTVNTAVGSLPISPVMDPEWMKARRRQKKGEATRPTGRFRRKLSNNPFALALISPIRKCQNTGVTIPRYFLQDLELVDHPDPSEKTKWWAPGPLAFESVIPTPRAEVSAATDGQGAVEEKSMAKGADKASEVKATTTTIRKTGQGQLTAYMLGRKETLDLVGKGRLGRKYQSALLRIRSGMLAAPQVEETVWRDELGTTILTMLRRRATDALIHRALRSPAPDYKFLQPCTSFDEAKTVHLRGCVLWLPTESKGAANQYATLDVEGAKFGAKMPVHDLVWLLGEEEVTRLRDAADVFRDSEILVLKQWKSTPMMKLHQLLWRLQGYLEPARSDDTSGK